MNGAYVPDGVIHDSDQKTKDSLLEVATDISAGGVGGAGTDGTSYGGGTDSSTIIDDLSTTDEPAPSLWEPALPVEPVVSTPNPTYGFSGGVSLEKEGFSVGPLGIAFGVASDKLYGSAQLLLLQYEAGYDLEQEQLYHQLDIGLSLRVGPLWGNWSATSFTKELWSTIGDIR